MINEFEFYHGAALRAICEGSKSPVSIEVLDSYYDNSAYSINNKIGLYIKHTKKRLTPWTFTFHKQHQDYVLELKKIYDEVVTLLICNSDGVVGLNFNELKQILDENHNDTEWIRVDRRKRELYKVTGSDGKLEFKIKQSDFIIKALSNNQKKSII